ncbi:minor tail protein [Microcystis phage Mae-Yong924-2]|nr:hypothetical protein [Microcystis phage Mea-Yong924-1]QYC50716.1 minor tail protein [Microcystis phage Mae-Yong924-2]
MQTKSTANVYINGVAADATLKSLRAEAAKLRNELAHLSPTSEEFTKKAERFREVDGRIQTLNGSLKQTKGLFGQIQTELGKVGTMAVAYLGFEAVTGQIGNLIRKNAEMSDSLADVMKTTGMTEAQVKDLNTAFSQIDTRTGRKELLELARDAGKLGITGKKDVEEFVRAADKINIALGEDLGKDAITQIGKLVSLFQLKEQFGLEQSMLKVASAMNTLGASSEASEGYITDFLSRMGGIAPMANISIDQVMALGATLDSLGQTSEVSSTALSKMFTKMASDAATYARIAGVSTAEFRQMMNDNALGAFMMVLEAAGKTEGGLVQLTETLGDLGVEGGRATGVFGVLAKNTDLLKKQMDIAKQSFQEGTSVVDEYNTKNTNLAANVEKLQKFFGSLFTNSMLSNGIKNMVSYFASFIDPAETAIETTQKLTNEINGQLSVLRTANLNNTQRKKLIDEINSAYGEYLPRLISEKDTTADIVQLQQQFNSNMATKMNMMRYEEEMSLILKRQQAAAEMLYNIEVKRAKMGSENLDANTFATITSQLMAQEAMAKAVLEGTDDQIQALKKKFINIQQFMGQNPTLPGSAAPTTNTTAGSGTTSSFKNREDELKRFYDLDLLLLKKSLADKAITQEEYDTKANELQAKHLQERIAAAKLYKEDTVKLELEYEELRIKQMEVDAKREEEAKKLAFEQIKNGLAEEEALIHENYANQLITQEQYEMQLQELKIGSLEIMLAAHKAYGDDVVNIEKQIAEAKAKYEKLKQSYATKSTLSQKELANELARADTQLRVVQQENLTDLLATTRGFFGENNTLSKMALGLTKAAAIAEIVVKAQLEKAAVRVASLAVDPTGILGTARARLVDARMGASIAIIGAQTIQELQGFYDGGYTGPGKGTMVDRQGRQITGVTHADEFVTPAWMLRDPVYANVVNWLEDKRVSKTPGHQAVQQNQSSTINNLVSPTDMSETNELLRQLLMAMQAQGNSPVVIGDDELWKMRERLEKLERAEKNAGFS